MILSNIVQGNHLDKCLSEPTACPSSEDMFVSKERSLETSLGTAGARAHPGHFNLQLFHTV